MKKVLIATLLATGLGFAGIQQASGQPGGGPGCGDYSRGGSCGRPAIGCQELDQQTKEKVKAFMTDNKTLRKEMAVKRTVRQAIMMSENPDPATAAKIAGELFDLRQTMKIKAEAAGIAEFVGPRGKGGPRMGGPGAKGVMRGGPPADKAAHPKFGRGQLDPEVKTKLDKFHADNKDLKKQIVMKRAVKQSLMRSKKIDYDAVAAVAGELFDLQTTMREKAHTAGVEQFLRPFGRGKAGHPANFCRGRHHRGPGRI